LKETGKGMKYKVIESFIYKPQNKWLHYNIYDKPPDDYYKE